MPLFSSVSPILLKMPVRRLIDLGHRKNTQMACSRSRRREAPRGTPGGPRATQVLPPRAQESDDATLQFGWVLGLLGGAITARPNTPLKNLGFD